MPQAAAPSPPTAATAPAVWHRAVRLAAELGLSASVAIVLLGAAFAVAPCSAPLTALATMAVESHVVLPASVPLTTLAVWSWYRLAAHAVASMQCRLAQGIALIAPVASATVEAAWIVVRLVQHFGQVMAFCGHSAARAGRRGIAMAAAAAGKAAAWLWPLVEHGWRSVCEGASWALQRLQRTGHRLLELGSSCWRALRCRRLA